jgi:hypothetical protein
MALEKYGVENRKELIEEELRQVREKLQEKTASEEELTYLTQREQDLQEALQSLA